MRAAKQSPRDIPIPGDWAEFAACRGMAPTDGRSDHPFFPVRGQRGPEEICAGCPVRVHCQTYALRWPVSGYWGGLPELSRIEYRRGHKRITKRKKAS